MPASEHSQDKPTGSCGSVTPSFIPGTLHYGHEHHRHKLLKASMWNPQATSSRLHASDLAAQGGTACVTGCVCHQAGMSDQACVQLVFSLYAIKCPQPPHVLLCCLCQAVVQQLQQLFPSSSPYVHPRLDTAVILPGQRSSTFDLSAAGEHTVNSNTSEW